MGRRGSLITSGIKDVTLDDDPKENVVGFFIQYHVAPTTLLGESLVLPFTLGHHPTVSIRIYAMDVPEETEPVLVREITEGLSSAEGYDDPATSSHGKYTGSPMAQGAGHLIGTRAYWSGMWDRDYDGNTTDGTDVDTEEYGTAFRAFLVLDGVEQGEYSNFAKPLP